MASNKKKETADMENKISNPNVKELEQTRTKKDDERAKRKRRAVSIIGLLIFLALSAAIAIPFICFLLPLVVRIMSPVLMFFTKLFAPFSLMS